MPGVAVVTGASSGIGLHTALGLARAGLRVVATVRSHDRSPALLAAAEEAGVAVEIALFEATDPASAAALVSSVGTVDVLVNNAGRGLVASLEETTDDDLRQQLEVNYLGVARLTRAVLPGMRAAGRGRIVTVTSVGGAVGQPFADAYCAAKFAVEGLMQSLAPVAATFGVDVCVVEPAAVSSEFVGSIERPSRGLAVYGPLRDAYLRRTAGAFASAQTPADAAAVVVEAATTPSPTFRWQTSPVARAFAGLSLADLDGDAVLAQTSTWIA